MVDRIRGVFFDLDGTLIRDGAVDAAEQTIGELVVRHPGIDVDRLRQANADVWSACWRDQGQQWMRGQLEDDALVRGVWRRTLERTQTEGGGVVRPLLEEAVQLHLDAERRTFTLFDETREVLLELRRRGVQVGLITNGPSASQRDKLRAVGIAGLFDLVIASGDTGVLKPNGAIFRQALQRAELAATEALHVGDNFDADVVGAADAGLTALWVNRDGAPVPRPGVPHLASPSLDVVLELVA